MQRHEPGLEIPCPEDEPPFFICCFLGLLAQSKIGNETVGQRQEVVQLAVSETVKMMPCENGENAREDIERTVCAQEHLLCQNPHEVADLVGS